MACSTEFFTTCSNLKSYQCDRGFHPTSTHGRKRRVLWGCKWSRNENGHIQMHTVGMRKVGRRQRLMRGCPLQQGTFAEPFSFNFTLIFTLYWSKPNCLNTSKTPYSPSPNNNTPPTNIPAVLINNTMCTSPQMVRTTLSSPYIVAHTPTAHQFTPTFSSHHTWKSLLLIGHTTGSTYLAPYAPSPFLQQSSASFRVSTFNTFTVPLQPVVSPAHHRNAPLIPPPLWMPITLILASRMYLLFYVVLIGIEPHTTETIPWLFTMVNPRLVWELNGKGMWRICEWTAICELLTIAWYNNSAVPWYSSWKKPIISPWNSLVWSRWVLEAEKSTYRRQEKGSDHWCNELNGLGCTITTCPSFPTKMLQGVKLLCKMCDSFMRKHAYLHQQLHDSNYAGWAHPHQDVFKKQSFRGCSIISKWFPWIITIWQLCKFSKHTLTVRDLDNPITVRYKPCSMALVI